MTKRSDLTHEFVEEVPAREDLADGVLYISITYATASHLCMDGCGKEVVTPLSPQQWQLIFDGRTVSLRPSIGNWIFACQSHYWIKNDRVLWDRELSREAIARTRARRSEHIRAALEDPDVRSGPSPAPDRRPSWIERLWRLIKQ